MEKKKYHLRIFKHEDLDLILLTISDHGKLKTWSILYGIFSLSISRELDKTSRNNIWPWVHLSLFYDTCSLLIYSKSSFKYMNAYMVFFTNDWSIGLNIGLKWDNFYQ